MSSPLTSPSIDPREVAHYSGLAETWWDDTGPFWPLHRLNVLRTEWIRERLVAHFGLDAQADAPLKGLRVLDVGCGGGILSESMARLGASVHGIDVVEKNIRIATLHGAGRGLELVYETTTAEALAERGDRYDVVLNMEVVEHVADVPGFMAACGALVAQGGVMFIATINRTPLAWLFAIVGAEYVLRWLPRGTHRWSLFQKPAEIAGLLETAGLRVTDRAGVRVNPLTRGFSIQSSLSVNYMLFATRERRGDASQSTQTVTAIGPSGD